jgi:diaminohydroxyphosphoribosylaminopyrimidine deaminase/5-amino-6-(5-phosphoribosylamino)uracil reductase
MSVFKQAVEMAAQFAGATSPNPPVGAVAIDRDGKVLSVGAHERAGTAHAEAKVIQDLRERGLLERVDTLFVTLEPCNHHGRTPPCTEAILASGIRHVAYGVRDPNPQVAGGGAGRLRAAGVNARALDEPGALTGLAEDERRELAAACRELIRPFAWWSTHRLPWVVVKTAHTPQGSMIPPPGQRTFTSEDSLRLAHELRRRSDAILTGSGTVLADRPELTVRRVPDHAIVAQGLKKRRLVVLDRRGRIPADWIERERSLGFEVLIRKDLHAALEELGRLGCLEILVEAGPELSSAILQGSLWNQHVLITQGTPDTIQVIFRE